MPVFDSNGIYAATLNDKAVTVWNVDTGKKLFVFKKENVGIIQFSHDSQRIAIALYKIDDKDKDNAEISVWDLTTGKEVVTSTRRDEYYQRRWINMEFSADNNRILTLADKNGSSGSCCVTFSFDIKENQYTQIDNGEDAKLVKFSPQDDNLDDSEVIIVDNSSVISGYSQNNFDIGDKFDIG